MDAAFAKRVAVRWLEEIASALPDFRGAFFHGSIHDLADDAPFPATSDVDVGVVFAGPEPPRLGKTRVDGVLVEGAPIAHSRLARGEQVLADYRLAPSFRRDGVIADPDGHLRRIQSAVAERFAEPRWVWARCEDARSNCLRYVRGLDGSALPAVQTIFWLFAEGNLTHVLLAAGSRNPTVRRRYAAARSLLAGMGRLDLHERLLAMLGCAEMSRARVEHHLDRLSGVLDRASREMRSDFPFGSDLSAEAHPVALDGSRELVAGGEHREAVFWIAVTWARCMSVLETDAPGEAVAEHEPGFRSLLRDLGVEGHAALRQRTAEVEAFLPELMTVAREIAVTPPT